eukprot:1852394-Rhodomonas_salina.1
MDRNRNPGTQHKSVGCTGIDPNPKLKVGLKVPTDSIARCSSRWNSRDAPGVGEASMIGNPGTLGLKEQQDHETTF